MFRSNPIARLKTKSERRKEGGSCGAGGGHSSTLPGFGCGCCSVYFPTAALLLNRSHLKHVFL